MTDPEVPDLAVAVPKALAALKALQPRYAEFEKLDAEIARAKSFLRKAKDEFTSLVAERDRARGDLASSKAELVTVQADLAARYRELEAVERQLKKSKGELR